MPAAPLRKASSVASRSAGAAAATLVEPFPDALRLGLHRAAASYLRRVGLDHLNRGDEGPVHRVGQAMQVRHLLIANSVLPSFERRAPGEVVRGIEAETQMSEQAPASVRVERRLIGCPHAGRHNRAHGIHDRIAKPALPVTPKENEDLVVGDARVLVLLRERGDAVRLSNLVREVSSSTRPGPAVVRALRIFGPGLPLARSPHSRASRSLGHIECIPRATGPRHPDAS